MRTSSEKGSRDQQRQRHRRRQMGAHEFEPQAEQRFDRAQQGVQRMRGAALLVPGQWHGDDAFERLAQHLAAARMRQAVGAACDQNEGDDVERAEARPQRHCRNDFRLSSDGIDDTPEQDRFSNGHDCQHDVGCANQPDLLAVGGKIAEGSPINFKQRHFGTP
jgi:hypothetical protein